MTVDLSKLESCLRDRIAPRAAAIDVDRDALEDAFRELGRGGWLALRAPSDWGGGDANRESFGLAQAAIARYSGALAFLQTQHQSAASLLTASDNDALKQEYLPHLATGGRSLGVGFSQLRRPDPPVTARPVPGGYRIDGVVPWVTGWSIFEGFILGSALPDGSALFGLVPFATAERDGGRLEPQAPMTLAAMTSTQTVVVNLDNWFLPEERVLSVKPPGWMADNSRRNILNHSFFVLGCARAGLDIVEGSVGEAAIVKDAFESLDRSLRDLSQDVLAVLSAAHPFELQLKLRARAIALAARCAHAAVAAARGAANSIDHPAQRVYREVLAFTVLGQTSEVREATLAQLAHLVLD